jgi:spermidine synthase
MLWLLLQHKPLILFILFGRLHAWGATDASLRQTPLTQIQARYEQRGVQTGYYTPQLHLASFALPKYVAQVIAATTTA